MNPPSSRYQSSATMRSGSLCVCWTVHLTPAPLQHPSLWEKNGFQIFNWPKAKLCYRNTMHLVHFKLKKKRVSGIVGIFYTWHLSALWASLWTVCIWLFTDNCCRQTTTLKIFSQVKNANLQFPEKRHARPMSERNRSGFPFIYTRSVQILIQYSVLGSIRTCTHTHLIYNTALHVLTAVLVSELLCLFIALSKYFTINDNRRSKSKTKQLIKHKKINTSTHIPKLFFNWVHYVCLLFRPRATWIR